MSAESLPINPTAFAEAIKELTLSTVYAKVAELRNSIAHLQRSNVELRIFLLESQDSEEDKKELEGYITENEGVMKSMEERLALLKTEVENRGQQWIEVEDEKENSGEGQRPNGLPEPTTNGTAADGHQSDNAGENGDEGVYL
ncbi:hypothetical protein N7462_000443 [Penicillium macrosclerotiorum]|uniref:uncharacterized protein n=1 Tax=Penicillium macrosclerotiorum TaxID=303699 RepID=UPI0025488E13|nr:uncharacterized protein N7462_000443 [Penicillium macrosclerotiorum]KAJ5698438.1 hypothetical protein N7462_000443 [Penicillium macrosclerotiorum]